MFKIVSDSTRVVIDISKVVAFMFRAFTTVQFKMLKSMI